MEPDSVTTKRSLADRALEAWKTAQNRLSEMRLARARGGDGAPTAAAVQKAREDAELAEDRAKLAAEDAEAYAAAEAAEAARAAIRAERTRVQAIHADTEAAARELHEAAERLGAALASFAGHINHLAATEPKLNSYFAEGAIHTALTTIGAAWPQNVPTNPARPIPFRDAARRARFPTELVQLLAQRLPVPPAPESQAKEAAA